MAAFVCSLISVTGVTGMMGGSFLGLSASEWKTGGSGPGPLYRTLQSITMAAGGGRRYCLLIIDGPMLLTSSSWPTGLPQGEHMVVHGSKWSDPYMWDTRVYLILIMKSQESS